MEDAVAEADLADPNPDVGDLFHHYDGLYFQGALTAAGFTVQWASSLPSATRSFGSCNFSKQQKTITLSESFLKYRSCTDRKNALLHEMIHAIMYLKHHRKDRNHGPAFRAWMDAINSCCVQDRQRPDGGYNITTRHDFIPEEPRSFLNGTVWKCCSCGDTLLRARNQGPPSDACCIENDDINASCGNMLCYWHNHKNDCSGTYEKTMLKLEAPSQKKAAGGAQLLLTSRSEMSNIQECSSSILQLECSKPNAEDKHLRLRSGSKGKPQGSSSSKKADKGRTHEMVGKRSVLPAAPQGKPYQNHGLAAMVKPEPVSVEGYNDAKSPGRDTSKKACKGHKSDDLQKTSVLPSAPQETPKPVIKRKASAFVASEKQRKEKCKRKPVKEKEYAVMSAWLNYYESDRSSGSTEPLINKRTERRRRERERERERESERERAKILTYSRSKKIKTAVVTTASQVVVTPATGDESQPSPPCLDVVPFLQPADPLAAPDLIVISDDD